MHLNFFQNFLTFLKIPFWKIKLKVVIVKLLIFVTKTYPNILTFRSFRKSSKNNCKNSYNYSN